MTLGEQVTPLDRVGVYEVTDSTRLEAEIAAHPLAAPMAGRVVRTHLELGHSVRAGEVLVEFDAEAERLALAEARARLAGLRSQIAALGLETEPDSAIPLEHGLAALVEVERISPVQLVLRVVGKWLSDKPSTPPVRLASHGAFGP